MSKKKEKRKLKEYDQMLKRYQKDREYIKLYRNVTEGAADIYGVITNMSKDFMQLVQVKDFSVDGEVITRQDHYDYIRCNKNDRTTRKILISEKRLPEKKAIHTKVDLSSYSSIFKDLKKRDIHVVIECEDLKNPTFTIGAIREVSKKSLLVDNYNAKGILDKKPTKVKYEDITLIGFGDNYSTTFRKHLRPAKKK